MRGTNGRLRLLALIACMLAALLLTAAALAESYPYETNTTAKVNLRRSASSSAAVLTRVPNGAEVTVTGKNGNYYQVTYGGTDGYILARYLIPYEEARAARETVTGYPYETLVKEKVVLYRSNDRTSAQIGTLPKGATVTVLSETNSYAKVRYGELTGYAKKVSIYMKKIVKAAPTPTPLPTLAPGADTLSFTVLQQGNAGEQVIALQSALIELGFLGANQQDGQYGTATAAAVLAFQRANGYPETGIADANLQAFLYSGKPLNIAGAKTKVKTLAPIDGVSITSGSKGTLVGIMQIRLKELGYYAGAITQVHDGATVSALKQFQKANGLTADGVAGAQTQDLLFSGAAIASGGTAPVITPTPTPVPTFRIPGGSVQAGSTGDDALLVQKRLKELGYYTGIVDGKFGSGSVSALKAFQHNNNLTADGKAGSATYAVLFSVGARPAGATPTPVIIVTPAPSAAPTPTPEPLTRANTVTVKLGVTGDAVKRLQERLTALGYYQAAADGVCKADDVAAIRAFQQLNGLKVDGAAGYETQVRLYAENAILYTGGFAAGTVSNIAVLRMGVTGSEVQQLQERLITLGYLEGKADGIYGTSTANAVIAFQRVNGLTRDGVAGARTLQLIYATNAKAAPTPTPVPTATPAPAVKSVAGTTGVLKRGDTSDAVRAMQQQLISLGYLTGRADGVFGVKTFEALKTFQRANRLSADGIAGSKTLSALDSPSAVSANGKVQQPAPTPVPTPAPVSTRPSASRVVYDNWYTTVKAKVRKFQYATVYDFSSGLSWQVHMFSFGAHADAEPLTAADTARMVQAFGGNTWNPKAVWVILGDGTVYMASTHSMPHEVQHITNNDFPGHLCIHFPRTQDQVTAIGPYATSHQTTIDAGWKVTQSMR